MRKPSIPVLAVLGLSMAIPLCFVLSTHLVWEDFLITFRFSENLARGRGLVYSPGEHVYGFTSPLNVLLPALFAWATGAAGFGLPLWLFRLVSLAGLFIACVATLSLLLGKPQEGDQRTAWLAGLLFPLIAVLEIKTTAFAMSGQEAGLVLGFLAPAFALTAFGWPAHWRLGGLLWAGLMYSRPDAFVYIAATMVAAFGFSPGSRRALGLAFLKSGLVCMILYLPWLLFTWRYYGSLIPHTVVAKLGVEAPGTINLGLFAPVAAMIEKAPMVLCWALSPIYDPLVAGVGTWPGWMHDCAFGLELLAVLYWLIPTRDRTGRMASLVSFLLFGYLTYENVVLQHAPWYFPPLAFMSLLTLVSAIAGLFRRMAGGVLAYGVGGLLLIGLLGFMAFVFSASLRPLRFKQEVIERQRQSLGVWLKEHAAPGETVYLEPLGYIGYYSGCKMLDWPGLVSPEVIRARKTISLRFGYTWAEVAEVLKPSWIVARPLEAEAMKHEDFLASNYELASVFSVVDQVDAVKQVPGMGMVFSESLFGVYHLKKGAR